jgi:hypothetical protein
MRVYTCLGIQLMPLPAFGQRRVICTPGYTEYLAICQAVAIGFAVMGFLGYFVKLVSVLVSH